MPAHAYPQPEATDPDPVVDALDAGLLHWVKGETSEALTCLRQARENADATGHDRRALSLARAAAELTPEDKVTPTSSPTASDAHSSEPRRSRLPEPPAPSKKYANTPASTAPSSGRPAPPSARPPDSPSVAPSAAHLGLRGAATPKHAAEDPRPSATPMPKTEPVKTAPVKAEPAAASHPLAADAEARPSTRSDAHDHRLASLRVRIDRVDPDGTLRVRLLDLAASASGEDNALLIVPQSIWQELKRNG